MNRIFLLSALYFLLTLQASWAQRPGSINDTTLEAPEIAAQAKDDRISEADEPVGYESRPWREAEFGSIRERADRPLPSRAHPSAKSVLTPKPVGISAYQVGSVYRGEYLSSELGRIEQMQAALAATFTVTNTEWQEKQFDNFHHITFALLLNLQPSSKLVMNTFRRASL